MPSVADITSWLHCFAPADLAADWDNVGLLLGDAGREVVRVMTCLTVTPDVAAEAVEERANLVVTHHPILFRAVKRLTSATPQGRMLLALAQAGIAVHSPHTAFDNTAGGINDMLASRLELTGVMPLRRQQVPGHCKIVVFVPEQDLECVSAALFQAGAGQIGQYRECSFRSSGVGTFFGLESSNPTVGTRGRRQQVAEWRLEALCPQPLVQQAVQALRAAHSYEEPAYDIYALQPNLSAGGEGRLGSLAQPKTLAEFAAQAKATLSTLLMQVVGEATRPVSRVAIVCGAGGDFVADAMRGQADVLVTGELRFHDYLAAREQGLALILPGHYASERFAVEELAKQMQAKWPDLVIWASRVERDPVWQV